MTRYKEYTLKKTTGKKKYIFYKQIKGFWKCCEGLAIKVLQIKLILKQSYKVIMIVIKSAGYL